MTIQMAEGVGEIGGQWLGFSGKGKFLTVGTQVFSTHAIRS